VRSLHAESIVALNVDRTYSTSIDPVHAVLVAGILPLFLGVLLSDIAYTLSYEVQWKNFASWLIIGGLAFGGLALLWAVFALFHAERRGRRTIYLLLLLATWVLGFINALVHAMDAWESMPEALILSAIVAALAVAALVLGFSTHRPGSLK
jgi:uncharacterized membrane protein